LHSAADRQKRQRKRKTLSEGNEAVIVVTNTRDEHLKSKLKTYTEHKVERNGEENY